jgi:hypothetical protein
MPVISTRERPRGTRGARVPAISRLQWCEDSGTVGGYERGSRRETMVSASSLSQLSPQVTSTQQLPAARLNEAASKTTPSMIASNLVRRRRARFPSTEKYDLTSRIVLVESSDWSIFQRGAGICLFGAERVFRQPVLKGQGVAGVARASPDSPPQRTTRHRHTCQLAFQPSDPLRTKREPAHRVRSGSRGDACTRQVKSSEGQWPACQERGRRKAWRACMAWIARSAAASTSVR